jgi:hypothetical protein
MNIFWRLLKVFKGFWSNEVGLEAFSGSTWLQRHQGLSSEWWITLFGVKNNVFWSFLKVFKGFWVTKSSYEAVFSIWMLPKTPRHDSIVINNLLRGQKTTFSEGCWRFSKVLELRSRATKLYSGFTWLQKHTGMTSEWSITSREVKCNVFYGLWRFSKVLEWRSRATKLFSGSKWLQKHPDMTSEWWITSEEVKNNVFWRVLKVFEGFGATKSAYGAFSEL